LKWIVWAILGAMLAALSFGDAYRAEGSYLTLIVMNFVIAIAMLMTPMMVRSLVGNGLQSMSSNIGATAVAAMVAPARFVKTQKIETARREALEARNNYMKNRIQKNNRN
jgi:hypothetical protein